MAVATIALSDREVTVSRPDILFPDDGITKMDLASYYELVAELMIPSAGSAHGGAAQDDPWQGLAHHSGHSVVTARKKLEKLEKE